MKKKELLKRIEILESMVGKFEVHKCMPTEKPIVSVPQWAKNLMKEASKDLTAPSIQPHPTAEKFKAIAAHANAINDVIQNAPKDVTIYVPDGILDDKTKEIINGNHTLFYEEDGWNVIANKGSFKSTQNQFKLVPCKREDLKAGDVAFVYLKEGNVDIKYEVSNLENYMIVTDKALVCWDCSSGGISVIDYELNGDHVWYKVVEA